MKKAATVFLVLSTLYLVLSTNLHAQTLSFDRAYQDYQYNLTLYEQSNSDFLNAKDAYKANQTLSLKETARQKLLGMLQSRDQLIVVYLTALRTKILELTGLSSDDKNAIFGKIDTEVNFYTNHKSGFSSENSLETLYNKNAESETQYKEKTSLIVKEALFDISLGQVEGLRIEHEKIYSALKSVIDTKVAAGSLTRDPFTSWISDIDATDNQLKENEGMAKSQIAQIYSDNFSFQGGYDGAIETLNSSLKPLSQLNEFLKEVLNYIKSHE